MANLNQALQELRTQHKQAQQEVQQLELAISAIEGLAHRNGSASSRPSSGSRFVSAAARRRMARAQRARWAKVRNSSQSSKGSGAAPARGHLSAAARRKIAAAQRARWARFRAEQGKKAA